MPPAARITDLHTCPLPAPVPHVGGPVSSGCTSVIIGYEPAARVGDSAICTPGVDKIAEGDASVLIGNQPAARLGDPTLHGGIVVAGCPTVIIGMPVQPRTDKPFCEECAIKAKREREQAARDRARGK